MTASNVLIHFDASILGEANALNFNSPLTVAINAGIANIVANTIKISELDSVSWAVGKNILPLVTNTEGTPVTSKIEITNLFGNIAVPIVAFANSTLYANVLVANSARLVIGNTTANVELTTTRMSISNSTASVNVLPGLLTVGDVTINTTVTKIGANVVANTSTIKIGNSTVYTQANSSTLFAQGVDETVSITSNSVSVSDDANNSVSISAQTISLIAQTHQFDLNIPTLEQVNSGGYFLNSKGEWSTVNVGISDAAGNNYNIQFNDNGTLGGADALNFDPTSNTVTLQNGLLQIGNSTVNATLNSTSIGIGNVVVNSTLVFVGNTTANTKANSVVISISNSTGSANLNAYGLAAGEVVINTISIAIGANVVTNTSTLFVSGTNSNASITSDIILVGNSTSAGRMDRSTIKLGTSTVNVVINTTAIVLSNSTSNTTLKVPTSVQWSATNYFLHANGSWVQVPDISSVPAAGNTTEFQYNNAGDLAGSGGFTWNSASNTATLANALIIGGGTVNAVINSVSIKLQNSTSNTMLSIPNSTERSGPFFLHANGLWINIVSIVGVSGANTQIQYNNSGSFGASGGFVFNYLSNTIFLGNTVANLVVNTSNIVLSNSTSNTRLKIPTTVQRAGNYFHHANGEWVEISLSPNTAPGGSNTEIQFNDEGSLSGATGLNFNKTTNNITISNTLIVGNSTVNAIVNSTSLYLANSTVNTKIAVPTSVQYGGAYYLHANGSWVTLTAPGSNTNIVFNDSGSFNGTNALSFNTASNTLISSNSIVANVTLRTGNSTVNGVLNSTALLISNSTAAARLTIPSVAQIGDPGYFLHANGEWVDITSIVTGIEDANNASYLNTHPQSFYTNASNLDAGTVAEARLPVANTSQYGITKLVDSVTNTSIIYAAAANSAKTAYDNGTTKAATAYSNAVTFASNATNLSSGTVAATRLPAANTSQAGIVRLVDDYVNTSITIAPTANALTGGVQYAVNTIYIAIRDRFGNGICAANVGVTTSYIYPFGNVPNGKGSGTQGGDAKIVYIDDPTQADGQWSFVNVNGDASAVFNGNGQIVCVSLSQTSDIRKKKEIVSYIPSDEEVSEILESIDPVRYKNIHDDVAQIGFIGQEMYNVFPEFVSEDTDGYLSVDYPKITAVLWGMVKNMNQRLELLEK